MKPLLFSIFVSSFLLGHTQNVTLPFWFLTTFKSKGLYQKFEFGQFLNPTFLQADFNGDASQDIAVLVIEKSSKKKGILLVHGKTNDNYFFGAGTKFGNGGDDFKWADKWTLYKKKTVSETQYDKTTGDILGGKEIQLIHPAILIEDFEDGSAIAGGIIYWTGKKYTWIHQGE